MRRNVLVANAHAGFEKPPSSQIPLQQFAFGFTASIPEYLANW
jgi:hypothetical protein